MRDKLCVEVGARGAANGETRGENMETEAYKRLELFRRAIKSKQRAERREERGAAALELIYCTAEYTDAIRSKNQAPVIDQIT